MKDTWDILIAGGGVGGIASALRAAAMGRSVLILDENRWLGGQITSQGVSVLDEHLMINTFGGTALYNDFRERIRQYYKSNYNLSVAGKTQPKFNPGVIEWQRRFSFEPTAGVKVINDMLLPALQSGLLTVLNPSKVVALHKNGDAIIWAMVKDLTTGTTIKVFAKYFIDATELGDLLPLADVPYCTGVESYAETHESSAPAESIPQACQSFTYTFAVEVRQGTVNTIPKPTLYEEMKNSNKFSMAGMKMYDQNMDPGPYLRYRQIIEAKNFDDPSMRNAVSLINCACTDYKEVSIIDKDDPTVEKHLYRAKQLALSYLYWLQTEAPREDGGIGYPELMLRLDLMGTTDGLAQHPYIRESRRIRGLAMIREDDIIVNCNHGCNRARKVNDSIGLGWYQYIDIHWCCHTNRRQGSGQELLPFQIPLGSILTGSVSNIIAGSKNISSTHISNGALRLHPVEWNIGESAGALAAFALAENKQPIEIYNDFKSLRRFQLELMLQGIPLYWFDDVPFGHNAFNAVQYLALEGISLASPANLHFNPDRPLDKTTGLRWVFDAKRRYCLNNNAVLSLQKKISATTKADFANEIFNVVKSLPVK